MYQREMEQRLFFNRKKSGILNQMMIERNSLKSLLMEIKTYNEETTSVTKTVQRKHIYTSTEGTGKDKKTVTNEVMEDYSYTVDSSKYESNWHTLDWQPIYVAAVEETLQNYYGNGAGGTTGSTATDSSEVANTDVDDATTTASELVEYAKSFEGGSYKYNGKSLKTGVDNSGFTMAVYNHFGYKLKHSAYKQEDAGKLVVKDNCNEQLLKPGDLILYLGTINEDTAIYIGGGQIIRCTMSKGIAISKLSEISSKGTFICARRILSDEGTISDSTSSSVANTWGSFAGNFTAASADGKAAVKKYQTYITKASEIYQIPEDMIKAIIDHENTSWNPTSKNNSSSATGLGQILEGTAIGLGFYSSDRTDPEKSILMVAKLLSHNLKEFKGDPIYSIAAYNQGAGGINSMLKSDGCLTGDVYAYVADVLSRFTVKEVTVDVCGTAIGKDLMNASIGYGTVDSNGRILLTNDQVAALVDDFKTQFTYSYDTIGDGKSTYTFEESQSLPNNGMYSTGDPNTEGGQYIWYQPESQLSLVETPYMDISYGEKNQRKNITIRLDRWESILRFYWPNYNAKWFKQLVELLPNGNDPVDDYNYYALIATDLINYSGDSIYDLSGTGSASGTYEALEGVQASINIPADCGGMSIPLYLQYDTRWGSKSYGKGGTSPSTITYKGCGPTALSMVLSYLCNECIYPDDIVEIIGNKYYQSGAGTSYGMFNAVASLFNCYATTQTVNADAITKALKKGEPVIVSTSGNGTTQEFTHGGHFIVLRGLTDDGRVLVNDPNDSTTKKHYAKSYDVQFIVNECKSYGIPKVMITVTSRK